MTGRLGVVEAWLGAVDRADVPAAMALCAPDVQIVGPRGTAGAQFLVADGAIVRSRRHDDGLQAALTAAGPGESDEVSARAG